MWNSLLGKAGGSSAPSAAPAAAPPADVPMPDAPAKPDGGAPPAAVPPEAGEPAYDGASLQAAARGKNVAVKVSLDGAEVGAPEESGDEAMAEKAVDEGPEKSTEQGALPPADAKPPAEPMEASANSSDADDGAGDAPPRRGRSASLGQDPAREGPTMDPAGPEESTASDDAPATPTPAAAAAEEGNFEASLLLGIAESASSGVMTPQPEKERREIADPSVLPTSMTSFLDMLTEEQRRVRHRHIPGVDGFRRLYKSEVKGDLGEARRMKKARHLSRQDTDASAMDVEDEEEGEEEDAKGHASDRPHDDDDEEDKIPDREAFVAPDRDALSFADRGQLAGLLEGTAFERALAGDGPVPPSSSGGGPSLKSPALIDSMVSFDPPRPQESTAGKTKHRLRRWEAHPNEVERDLDGYRKTVARTREELHSAQKERERIEAVASLVRSHLAKHLAAHRAEVLAAHGEWRKVRARCVKLEEERNGRSVSTRGGARGMKDALAALTALGAEIAGAAGGEGADGPADWRGPGAGGAGAPTVAGGWFLVGDAVRAKGSGEEGTVVSVNGPGRRTEAKKKEPVGKKADEAKADEAKGDEAKADEKKVDEKKVDETKADEEKEDDGKKDDDKKPEASPSGKGGDAMDVDSPDEKKETADAPKKATADDPKKATADSPKKEEEAPAVLAASIGVQLAKTGEVKAFAPSELEFGPDKLPPLAHADPSLAKRWEGMIASALANGVEHDASAMDGCIAASLNRRRAEDAEEEVGDEKKNDGSASPKSVADERGLLPFGAGLVAAPAEVRNYPGLMSMEMLEKTVRKVTYETDRPRVIADMAAASPDLRKFEARREEINRLKGKVLQLRNRLGRQKRLRSLNERSLRAGKARAHKAEGLLLEMRVDLRNLKGRLREELDELGIGSGPLPSAREEGEEGGEANDGAGGKADEGEAATDGLLEPESKRPRVEESDNALAA